MPYGLYMSAAGAEVQSRLIETLSHNMANVNTPGFKRELAILQSRHAEAIEQGASTPGSRSINDIGGGVRMMETVTDFRPGLLKQTGKTTDLAIQGNDGFFVVTDGEREFLTRAGNFQMTPTGHLVTGDGFQLLADGGEPIQLLTDPRYSISVHADGSIAQMDDRQVETDAIPLAIKQPASLQELVREGENMFSSPNELQDLAPEQRQIVSGFLEQSAVRPELEMMQLIEASRAYEANVRLIQNQDQMMGSLLNRLLRV